MQNAELMSEFVTFIAAHRGRMRPTTVAVNRYRNIVGVGALDDPQLNAECKVQSAELMSDFVTFIYPCCKHTIFILYYLLFIILHGRFVKRPYNGCRKFLYIVGQSRTPFLFFILYSFLFLKADII